MASRRDEVNRALKEYIAARKKSSGFSGIFKFSSKPKMEPSAYAGHSKDENVAEFVEQEYSEKKGWLKKAFSGVFGEGKKEEMMKNNVYEEEAIKDALGKEDTARDMKELARISLAAIKKLPPNEIHQFRGSEDFATLKRILKKHGLIRQDEP